MENNKQQHQILHSNCFLFIQVIFDAKNAYGVAVRISGRMNLDTYIPKLLTLAWTFSFKVWNSIFIFHELLLYISKVSNNIWTPSSSCILYVHCHENMVLCCCLSPSVCGKIVQPDHRPYKLHVPKSRQIWTWGVPKGHITSPATAVYYESRFLEIKAADRSHLAHMNCQLARVGR